MSKTRPPSSAAEQEVREEDQQRINSFNKFNTRLHELQAGIKAKKAELEDLDEASNELMLVDEDQVRYVIGESFYHAGPEEAEEQLQAATSAVQKEISGMDSEITETQSKMASLKKELYGKFGNSINLEDE